MSRKIPDPRMLAFARQLLAHEAAASLPEPVSSPVFRVFEGLRRSLGLLAGVSGFRALLLRALTLAKPQAPALAEVKVNPDGSLQGFSELPDSAASEAGVALIVELLGLLSAFIGESLAISIVTDEWPALIVFPSQGETNHDPRR
jgi:hypothetical protein